MITRETDYALRLLRTLRDGERRTAAEAAERELVPQSFAHKILKKLARAGFVEVARGAEGGCRLSAELNRVTLYDLMTAMGEDSRLSSCMDPTYSCPWRASHGGCTVHCHLTGIQEKLNAELKKLARAGFVEVARGAEGGCRLSAELNRVTLYDLMTAMGEDSRLSSCMDPTYSCPWRASHGGCTVHCHLTGIQEKLNAELKAHTLEDILGPAD